MSSKLAQGATWGSINANCYRRIIDKMNLYERDYTEILNQEEFEALELYKEFHSRKGIKCTADAPEWSYPNEEVRRFLWHFNSLFPNNYLYHLEPKRLDLEKESNKFRKVVYNAKNENEIQSYIKSNKKWFIPASLYKEYNFAHHGAYLFPELSFGAEYTSDYCLLGRSSDGFSIVLVEFEKANVPFMIKTQNSEGESVRKGITQIRDWKRWLDDNRDYFIRSMGLEAKAIKIPTSRIHYCLVVSRRGLMDQCAADLRSQLNYETQNLKIVSYDRLIDNILKISNGY